MTNDDDKKRGRQKDFSSIGDVLQGFEVNEEDKYISREFQKYGYDLAEELNDLEHKALYIKLAKEEKRGLLETARNFVKDAKKVNSPAKLFMWKLNQLKKDKEDKKKKEDNSSK